MFWFWLCVKDGWTALIFAADANSLETVKILLEYDADVNVNSGSGFTALYFAADSNNIEMGKFTF